MWKLFYKSLCLWVLVFHCACYSCKSISRRSLQGLVTTQGEVLTYIGVGPAGYLTDTNIVQVLPLRDLRQFKEAPDLKTHGFTYVQRDLPEEASLYEAFSEDYTKALERDAIALVKKLTGSRSAFCCTRGYRGNNLPAATEQVVRTIHSDLSPEGARFIKSNLILPKCEDSNDKDTKKFREKMLDNRKRVVIFNVWRPLQRVERDPLAFCDWQTVSDEHALNFGHQITNPTQALQAWNYDEQQDWYYLSQQEPNEVFVFVQHDSAAPDGHGMNIPHVSPHLTNTPDGIAHRISVEFRVAAIVDSHFKLDHERKSTSEIKSQSKVESFFKSAKSIFRKSS